VFKSNSPDFLAIISDLKVLRRKALECRDQLQASHPDWPVGQDARLTVFAKIVNIINACQLSLMFLDQHLLDDQWWAGSALARPEAAAFENTVIEYSQFTKTGFVQGLFSSVESGMRVFLRSLDPLACDGSTAAFENVYTCLLRTKLSRGASDEIALLDLWRNIRNVIHNNGAYFHGRGTDRTVIYDGISYDFPHGRPIEFVTWQFLLSRSTDLVDMVNDVVLTPEMSQLPAPVVDPMSYWQNAVTSR
jgi:hypothetical protein